MRKKTAHPKSITEKIYNAVLSEHWKKSVPKKTSLKRRFSKT
jgi:hypothetical protein